MHGHSREDAERPHVRVPVAIDVADRQPHGCVVRVRVGRRERVVAAPEVHEHGARRRGVHEVRDAVGVHVDELDLVWLGGEREQPARSERAVARVRVERQRVPVRRAHQQ